MLVQNLVQFAVGACLPLLENGELLRELLAEVAAELLQHLPERVELWMLLLLAFVALCFAFRRRAGKGKRRRRGIAGLRMR